MDKIYSLNEVSNLIGIKPHRIVYAITNGDVDEPKCTFINKRVFTDKDIQKLKDHFETQKNTNDRNR